MKITLSTKMWSGVETLLYRSREPLQRSPPMLSVNRYSRFAWNACLAESAAVSHDAEARLHVGSRKVIFVVEALFLVVSRSRDRSRRAPLDAFSALSVREVETICVVVGVGSLGRRDLNAGDNRPAAHGLACRGDETVAQTEGAESRNICGVPLGPDGGKAVPLGCLLLP